MGFSQYPTITDELLSAYIDNVVNDDERAAVEAAIANDSEIAWRVESLRRTVSLLGQLTDVPLPRSFALNEALLEMTPANEAPRQAIRPHATGSTGPFWKNWLDFWRSGSMIWRNAAAVCALLLMVFLVGDFAVTNEMPTAQDAAVSVARNSPAADTLAVTDDEIDPAAVAMASKSAVQVEEQTAPEPMAAAAESDGEPVEAEAMQPATTTMNSEQDVAEEIAIPAEGPPENESSSDDADEVDQADVAVADDPGQAEALSAAPMMFSAAAADAGEAMLESPLATGDDAQTRDEAGDGVDESVAGPMVAASLLGDNDVLENFESTPVGDDAEAVPSSDVAEPMMAATVAEPASDAASPIETEAQPRAVMLTDAEGVETKKAEEEVADEEAADTESLEAVLPETERLVAERMQVDAPEAEASATQVSEPAAAEVAVQEAPQSKTQSEAVRPSAVAMVDSVEQSARAKPRRPSSENMAELASTPAEENVSNSAQLFSIVQLLLAILALLFFILWLRSRSQSETVSSQD